MKDKISVIIPARNEVFLQKTVDSIFANAKEDVEIIVMLDGYWPVPALKANDKLILVHLGEIQGMRKNINAAVRIATGKYLMKCDAHCGFAEGFDMVLKEYCEPKQIHIPSRYSLNAENWKPTRGPVDYLTLTFPYIKDDLFGYGFHGRKWKGERGMTGSFWHRENERRGILIDEIIAFQGSFHGMIQGPL